MITQVPEGRVVVRKRAGALAAGLLAGTLADALIGDPRRGHPVAGFGRAAASLRRRTWADSLWRGTGYTGTCVGGVVAIGLGLERILRTCPARYGTLVAATTWVVLGGRTLAAEAGALRTLLDADDLPAARTRLNHLVSRDPSGLDAGQVCRAGVESLAENTSDAVVAPLLWGAVAGIPGLIGYRAANTLDAMVGYRSARYARFGWAAARLDDLVNLVPARTTALLVTLLSGRPQQVWAVVRQHARRHPSPNAGWCEAAFAAALGLRLGGANVYGGRVEHRPQLGVGRPAGADDLARAARLSQRVTAVAALLAAGGAAGARVAWFRVTARNRCMSSEDR